jgi:thiol-disulfide isomerase/thioredoxin
MTVLGRSIAVLVMFSIITAPGFAQTAAQASTGASKGPADPKAAKTFAEGAEFVKEHKWAFALDDFRKADKQDGGHCIPCELQAYKAAGEIADFKAQKEAAHALTANVSNSADKVRAHFLTGQACMADGIRNHHDKPLEEADTEFRAGLQVDPKNADCLYADGAALAHLKQDAAAKERFEQFLQVAPTSDKDYARAQRFAEHPDLARARVAPNFELTTLDGKKVTLESLTGKVVLIDFWATWCGPCREALPHVLKIAKRFEGQPFVVLSISLDRDDTKWKDFVAQNGMTWLQYRDGYFNGPIATLFGVTAIPATFTIDADGVLQDQHVGDADIEGKLKKLIARAQEAQSQKSVAELR